MTRFTVIVLASLLMVTSANGQAQSFSSPHYWPPAEHAQQQSLEALLNAQPAAASLKTFHDQYAGEPHLAGTPGDERTITRLATTFRMLGLDVEVHEFWAYLSTPIDAAVEIITPEKITLPVKERPVEEDRFTKDRALTNGFNAYSASGDVTGEVVYANYGTKEDFVTLKNLGIDCTGKIVLARYGKNFRGYKAKFAQQAGAAALLIYTDPADSGFVKGAVYPEGGWANETLIQRGSIVTLPYPGDPLTPGIAATEHAERLDPDAVDLPRIPVQPIGYGAAGEIIARMAGRELPEEIAPSWKGGVAHPYRLEGGPDLRVRVMVQQERSIVKTANVLGTMWGTDRGEQRIVIGCHHDAWCHGAGDPMAGLIVMMEAARSLMQAHLDGHQPSRSITFAAWGAEEYGIIGSTEWCEQFKDLLSLTAVAYINLDAAAMGPAFGSAASPSLKRIIEEVTRDVPNASNADASVHQVWLGDREHASFGNLGGGSDHVGFYCHLGIPSCGLSAGGSAGSAYHSNYDTITWYRKIVGSDYQPALMLTRIVNLLTARFANAAILPLDPVRYAVDTRTLLPDAARRADASGVTLDLTTLHQSIDEHQRVAQAVRDEWERRLASNSISRDACEQINAQLLLMERDWLRQERPEETVDGGSWYRNLYAMSDPDSGYAALMLPGFRVEGDAARDPAAWAEVVERYRGVFERLASRMNAIENVLAADSTMPREQP